MRSEEWIWEEVQRAGKKKFLRTSYSSGLASPEVATLIRNKQIQKGIHALPIEF